MSGNRLPVNFDLFFSFTILLSFCLIAISTNLIDAQVISDSKINYVPYIKNFNKNSDGGTPYPMKTRPFDSYERFRNGMKMKLSKYSTKNNDKIFRPTIRFQQSKTSRNCFFSPIQCQLNIKKLNDLKDPSFRLFNKRPNLISKQDFENDKKIRFLILN
ncbi:Hypothetical protein SRAE_1000154000 [Strongyloides ratti]|uniref:Uncharacterized protein n=1 Tax=Strongyloides ratti TaxID=34506 RepID=A0A090L5A8_STRRB|nr:Hypothetical protein SRAE_1000154000 [Strongyloides ratti]CEF63277.1 Hypothetical protein SRAE_1000154000 [Strongyloides ratti]